MKSLSGSKSIKEKKNRTKRSREVVFCKKTQALVDKETGDRITLTTEHEANLPKEIIFEKETDVSPEIQVNDLLYFNPVLLAENIEESMAFVKTLLDKMISFKGNETLKEVIEEIYPAILLHVIESIRELDLVKVHEYIERISSNTRIEKSVPCYFNYELRSPHAFATARTRLSTLFALVCGMNACEVSKKTAKESLLHIENTIQQRLVTITQSLNDDFIQDIKEGKLFGEVR